MGRCGDYSARPATGDKFPVVVVIHENRGLNPYIEDVVRRLAVAGFMALGPDAIWPLGGYPSVDKYGAEADEKALGMQKQLDGGKITEDFVAAGEFLLKHPQSTGKLGAVGFCFGGGMVNQLAVRMPQLAAGVPFYGEAPAVEDVPKIKAALLLNFAETDPHQRQVARVRSRPQGEWRQLCCVCVSQNESRLP